MARLKDVKMKIAAVKKTRQITKAMNMVAASKLRGAQGNMDAFRPYAAKFAEVLGSLAEKADEAVSPLLVPREEVRNVHVVLCTSDRGLCGGFNTNLIEKARTFCQSKKSQDVNITLTNFGKKGRDWARKNGFTMIDQFIGVVGGRFDFSVAAKSGRKLVEGFLSDEYDEVFVIYSEFVSMARQIPTVKQLLPIPALITGGEAKAAAEDGPFLAEHICEPSSDELLGEMLPRNVYVQLFSALLETSTSEHAARMAAMDNATKACKDIINSLTLAYNKARQSAITAELMDIVGGAEALRG